MSKHDDARNAIAEAVRLSIKCIEFGTKIPIYEAADRVMEADPLRRVLGAEAAKALLEGRAAVVPVMIDANGSAYLPSQSVAGLYQRIDKIRLDCPNTETKDQTQ